MSVSEWGDIGNCDQCDKEAIPISFISDPYNSELFPEDITEEDYSNWCEGCFNLRSEDL